MKNYRITNNGKYAMAATVRDDQTGVIKVVIKDDRIEPDEVINDFTGLVFELYDNGVVNERGDYTDYELKADISKKTIFVKIKSHECSFEDNRVVSEFTYNLGRILSLSSKEASV